MRSSVAPPRALPGKPLSAMPSGPLTAAIILLLLYLNFGRLGETLIVMLSVPFALVGGVWLMYLLDYDLSVAAAVGFMPFSMWR